ncbi:hypothetical protein BV22DRAFT_1135094 [Leucogyrophana mollusca]|uniref:Uncharacterized protein n=1 Tax=Leucogyrophana mollusca TaxID=85980 RepID=A0ACB8AWQ8_9AGAM|nr:hypothetical protein BV22DRAFT_1135094 [Leucogyrophana mollusca]
MPPSQAKRNSKRAQGRAGDELEVVTPREPFTMQGFKEKMADFVIASGKGPELVDSPNWHNLMRVLRPELREGDLPTSEEIRALIPERMRVRAAAAGNA